MGRVEYVIIQGPEWERVILALREIDMDMVPKLRAKLKAAANPLETEVKGRALALPAHSGEHSGLRGRIARGVGTRVRMGRTAGVRITTSMSDPQEAILPRGMDSMTASGGWTHPVFGRGRVFQKGYSWFTKPLSRHEHQIQGKVKQVVDDAADFVARQGG